MSQPRHGNEVVRRPGSKYSDSRGKSPSTESYTVKGDSSEAGEPRRRPVGRMESVRQMLEGIQETMEGIQQIMTVLEAQHSEGGTVCVHVPKSYAPRPYKNRNVVTYEVDDWPEEMPAAKISGPRRDGSIYTSPVEDINEVWREREGDVEQYNIHVVSTLTIKKIGNPVDFDEEVRMIRHRLQNFSWV